LYKISQLQNELKNSKQELEQNKRKASEELEKEESKKICSKSQFQTQTTTNYFEK
jgi:hypothetical protein